jgi:tetratricopeptide (TPR) repeat protein
MSPEQALGRSLDRRSDLYAASIVFFEMLAGKTPFAHDEAVKVLAGHVSGSVPLLREVAEVDVPATVETLIRRGLAKKPDERPATAEAYLEELERALSVVNASTVIELSSRDLRTVASSSSSVPLPHRTWTRKQRLAAGAAALGALLIGIVAAVASGGDDAPAPAPVAKRAPAEPALEMAPEDRDDGLGAAIHLAASGRREDAVGKLRTLRKAHPRDARIPAALGHVYAELGWPKQTLDAYRDALRLDPELRSQPVLIEDVTALLESKSTWTIANRMIERDLGEAAVPALREMSEHHPDSIVRGRAARLVAKLSGE